ncbi:MAG: hypothetical protein ACYCYP_01930 [Leptospirales bacterium]
MANFQGAGPTPGGARVTYGVDSAVVIKPSRGVLFRISVLVAGTAPGAAYNDLTVNSPTEQICSIPATVGTYEAIWPCNRGITIIPGTGQTLSVSWE